MYLRVCPRKIRINIRKVNTNLFTTASYSLSQIPETQINFAKRPKFINMQEIRKMSYESISKQFEKTANSKIARNTYKNFPENYEAGVASFGITNATLPSLVSKRIGKTLSTAVAFNAILHEASNKRLRLFKDEQESNNSEFFIRKIAN